VRVHVRSSVSGRVRASGHESVHVNGRVNGHANDRESGRVRGRDHVKVHANGRDHAHQARDRVRDEHARMRTGQPC
jgi:hypothetical protein